LDGSDLPAWNRRRSDRAARSDQKGCRSESSTRRRNPILARREGSTAPNAKSAHRRAQKPFGDRSTHSILSRHRALVAICAPRLKDFDEVECRNASSVAVGEKEAHRSRRVRHHVNPNRPVVLAPRAPEHHSHDQSRKGYKQEQHRTPYCLHGSSVQRFCRSAANAERSPRA
jgi:hypothetical protein